MDKIIDLRSDTVTKPSPEMRKAMYEAEVGDDVYKEDPTVNELEEYVADLLGKESALFVPSGMMGNQICLNVMTQPGDEVICERTAHIFQYESGTPAAISGIQLNLIEGENGVITREQIEPLIRPESAYYMPRTRAIEIENTHNVAGGTIHPISNIKSIQELADEYGLFMHLDGARLWNASVATGIPLGEYASYFDSLSVCISKGLGAPVGSVIASDVGFIKEAFRVRKAWGGGMRQVGIIAAGALYAVKHNIKRLAEDHENAKNLSEGLANLENVEINLDNVHTNIVMFKPLAKSVEQVIAECKEKGLLLGPGGVGIVRAVTHLDVDKNDIKKAKEILAEVIQ
ncbi:MAG: low specificity L-threonine aldolase [Chlorobi bacterium]|nr:low specificity L-threonine aldolase [Chlorobiota bacterium]